MNKKEEILKLYYEEHHKQKDIAEKLKITQGYVSQIIKTDERYNTNKETKHKISMFKKAKYNKEYYKAYKRPKRDDNLYQELQAMLNKDTAELSYQGKYNISDYAFTKWNRSIFRYAKESSNLVLKKGINVTKDVPRVVRNIVHPSSIRSSRVY